MISKNREILDDGNFSKLKLAPNFLNKNGCVAAPRAVRK